MRPKHGALLFSMMAPAVGLILAAALLGSMGRATAGGDWGGATIGATNSSPIAITSDDRFVWVVNPDNNSVSVLEVGGDVNIKRKEIKVGKEPRCLAITPDNSRVYVTNMESGNVSVINAVTRKLIKNIKVGAEPFGCALTPDGSKLYVANFSSESVSVISTTTNKVIKTIQNVGPFPRGIAITADGSRAYVTQFLARLRNDGRSVAEKEGRDDGKEGRVTVINTTTDIVAGTVVLNPLANVGFKSDGSVLDRINPDGVFEFDTGAFPNLLESIVLKGNKAYVPNTASSPNGPVRFNVNVQAFLSVFDTASNLDSGQTINMNRGIQFEAVGKRLFATNPIAIDFKNGSNVGYVVSAATNRIIKVELDGSGAPTINAPTAAGDPGNIIRVEVGKNPQGIVINSTDTRAYVFNYISRDVSVVDIQTGSATENTEIGRIASSSLPPSNSFEAILLRGNELFNTGIGPAGTQDNALPPAGRMSDFGWGSCYSCHPDGRTDGVTWMFASGPRQTTDMSTSFAHPQPPGWQINSNGAPLLPSSHQRVFNWSAIFDEVQDFELNIRNVSGGQGLITDGNPVVGLTPTANTGRSADLDAIAAYTVLGIRAPVAPAGNATQIKKGRLLFEAAGCHTCHGGVNWTRSRVDYTPPPGAGESIVSGQLVRFLTDVGTYNPNAFNEVRIVGGTITQGNTLGSLGFNIPSLIGVANGGPYLHDGSAQSLEQVLENVTHRSAGSGGVDKLGLLVDRLKVVAFLRSISLKTVPFP